MQFCQLCYSHLESSVSLNMFCCVQHFASHVSLWYVLLQIDVHSKSPFFVISMGLIFYLNTISLSLCLSACLLTPVLHELNRALMNTWIWFWRMLKNWTSRRRQENNWVSWFSTYSWVSTDNIFLHASLSLFCVLLCTWARLDISWFLLSEIAVLFREDPVERWQHNTYDELVSELLQTPGWFFSFLFSLLLFWIIEIFHLFFF